MTTRRPFFRLTRWRILPGLLMLALSACGVDMNGPQRKAPYIFTQQHNAKPMQQVRLGWPLQVQLPGNPAVWTIQDEDTRHVESLGQTLLYSPQRIAGTQSLFIFDFTLSVGAEAGDTGRIVISTDNLPASLANVVPGGRYSVEFLITP